jgi:hypothetical protein
LGQRRWPVAVACCGFLLFAANCNAYRVVGDGRIPFEFLRRLFGEAPHPIGYQFGQALLEAPLYALG